MSVTGFVDELTAAWGSWAPTLSDNGDQITYLSDRSGKVEVWAQDETGAERQASDQEFASVPSGQSPVVAPRPDAELDSVSADGTGHLVLMNWQVAGGGSELELRDTHIGRSRVLPDPDGSVISGAVISHDGSRVAAAIESPIRPREIWSLAVESMVWNRVSAVPKLPLRRLVRPTLEFFYASDGYPLTGLLYRPAGDISAGPAVITLPASPKAPERPTFNVDHQAMVAAGISVFAPHVRGWSGITRSIDDTVAARGFLLQLGYADPNQIALAGPLGSSLPRAVLAAHPQLFTGGVVFQKASEASRPTIDASVPLLVIRTEGAESHQPEVRRRLIQQRLDFFASLW